MTPVTIYPAGSIVRLALLKGLSLLVAIGLVATAAFSPSQAQGPYGGGAFKKKAFAGKAWQGGKSGAHKKGMKSGDARGRGVSKWTQRAFKGNY